MIEIGGHQRQTGVVVEHNARRLVGFQNDAQLAGAQYDFIAFVWLVNGIRIGGDEQGFLRFPCSKGDTAGR